jgi:hypothetical protein
MTNIEDMVLWDASDDDVAPYVQQARFLWSTGERTKAMDFLRALVFVAPRARVTWRTLANWHLELGDVDVAAALDALGSIVQETEELRGAA